MRRFIIVGTSLLSLLLVSLCTHFCSSNLYTFKKAFFRHANKGHLHLHHKDHQLPGTMALASGTQYFSARTLVSVDDHRGIIAMRDLKVGDKVLTSSRATKSRYSTKYETVYAFANRHSNVTAEFLQFHTTSGDIVLEVSPDHLLHVKGCQHPISARRVQVGDSLLWMEHGFVPIRAVITILRHDGTYAPLTSSGDILVNGNIKASVYGTPQRQGNVEYVEFHGRVLSGISQHDMTHICLSPLRILCLGIAPRWCAAGECVLYMDALLGYYRAAVSHDHDNLPLVVKTVLLALLGIVCGSLHFVESMVGPVLAPWVIVVISLMVSVKYGQYACHHHAHHNTSHHRDPLVHKTNKNMV